MSDQQLPILYTFRRCPYAMRARIALCYANITVECREIALKNKHATFLETSPKGTVPVLVVDKHTMFEESLEIVDYVCELSPTLLKDLHIPSHQQQYESLLTQLSEVFVPSLHAVKYNENTDDKSTHGAHHAQMQAYCMRLEQLLTEHDFLFGDALGKADIVIFPFMRQLSRVNENIFNEYQLPLCQQWLERIMSSTLFKCAMQKYPTWQSEQVPVIMQCG